MGWGEIRFPTHMRVLISTVATIWDLRNVVCILPTYWAIVAEKVYSIYWANDHPNVPSIESSNILSFIEL
jgi:hypothetical protein